MKPILCKAGQQLREQIDDAFPNRDRKSDGWIGDARHQRAGTSDHLPDKVDGYVRAIDVDDAKEMEDLTPNGREVEDDTYIQ